METELSFAQETGERTSFSREALDTTYEENLRSPLVRNTVVDAKAGMPLDWNGEHRLTFGGQVLRTLVEDQNPGAQAHLPPEQRYDEELSLDEWAVFAEDEWRMREDFALTLGLRFSDCLLYTSDAADE